MSTKKMINGSEWVFQSLKSYINQTHTCINIKTKLAKIENSVVNMEFYLI